MAEHLVPFKRGEFGFAKKLKKFILSWVFAKPVTNWNFTWRAFKTLYKLPCGVKKQRHSRRIPFGRARCHCSDDKTLGHIDI